MENKKNQLSREELENTTGGWNGQYKYVDTYNCPICGQVNVIRQYCYSEQTTWKCEHCPNTFTIIC